MIRASIAVIVVVGIAAGNSRAKEPLALPSASTPRSLVPHVPDAGLLAFTVIEALMSAEQRTSPTEQTLDLKRLTVDGTTLVVTATGSAESLKRRLRSIPLLAKRRIGAAKIKRQASGIVGVCALRGPELWSKATRNPEQAVSLDDPFGVRMNIVAALGEDVPLLESVKQSKRGEWAIATHAFSFRSLTLSGLRRLVNNLCIWRKGSMSKIDVRFEPRAPSSNGEPNSKTPIAVDLTLIAIGRGK